MNTEQREKLHSKHMQSQVVVKGSKERNSFLISENLKSHSNAWYAPLVYSLIIPSLA